MKILGIETSCDETGFAVVEKGVRVLSNAIYSQVETHSKTGGVVPEVAAREHVLKVMPVLDQCLGEAEVNLEEIDAIAVTKGPGLVSSLIIGTTVASTLSNLKGKPLIPVNHIAGHLYSNWLDVEEKIDFPALVLTVSGGHNELVMFHDHYEFELLGETLDDAAGEAFDKVARMLGLGYPGGPAIAKAALHGDKFAFELPRVMMDKESLDFSFSGLKTATLNIVLDEIGYNKKESIESDDKFVADLAASFEFCVAETLTNKLLRALEKFPVVKEVHLAGGVSANLVLRDLISQKIGGGFIFRYPKNIRYCTDNAAMIASAGFFKIEKFGLDKFKAKNVIPDSSLSLYE